MTSSKNTLAAVNALSKDCLSAVVSDDWLSFETTDDLLKASSTLAEQNPHQIAWQLHPNAWQAAQLGLEIKTANSHLLVLGEAGACRTSLMQEVVRNWQVDAANATQDWVAIDGFSIVQGAEVISLPAGAAGPFCQSVERALRQVQNKVVQTLNAKVELAQLQAVQASFEKAVADLTEEVAELLAFEPVAAYFAAMQAHFKQLLADWQPSGQAEGDPLLESLLSDTGLGRYRVQILVSHPNNLKQPAVVLDDEPSLSSLFGGIDSAGDGVPLFSRLRAGSLLRANGGVLILHLRDLLADEQQGPQLVEKLYRFCRNGTLSFEDHSGSQLLVKPINVPLNVKLVLIASRDDYYAMLDEQADLFRYFPIKVEFVENVKASKAHYQLLAGYIAAHAQSLSNAAFSKAAVQQLLRVLHRLEEDQSRLSTQLTILNQVMVESLTIAGDAETVDAKHVQAAVARRDQRHSYIEGHVRDSIVDQELMINVDGEFVGQINGLTHVDLAEASFGSPIRISANCYPGLKGVVTIDREVTMSGPTHDKGVLIMQSWLQQHFANYAPLNFTASLVFEQEYEGVDGDSASCAELFALMSALTQLPINQAVAVTGGMNQQGEVLPVGGLNEKIEGYFRVCQAIGLNGKQGVLIPAKNMRHLVLNDEVLAAVEAGDFHIATMSRVEEGLMYLTDTFMEDINHHAAARLQWFKTMIENNKPSAKHKGDH